MKKLFLALALPAILISCNKAGKDEFVLTGTVKGSDGKNIILQRQDDSLGIVAVDTVKIENGKFSFTGTILEPSVHSLTIEDEVARPYLIVENGEINIDINKDTVSESKISGTYNNEQLMVFNDIASKIRDKMIALQKSREAEIAQARQTQDTVMFNKLRKEFEVIDKEMQQATLDYVKSHPKAFISAVLINNMFRAPQPDLKQIQALYNGLDKSVKDTKAAKEIEKKLREVKRVGVGKPAPQFSAPGPDGKTVSLHQSMGKLTIIDFWASWCGPCRAANPELVAVYNEFHPKGLNIIGVSLDQPNGADKWKEAIAKDKLAWTQVSNLKFWNDPIAVMYNVKEIPKMFILNEKGLIIAQDLKGEALRKKLKEFLG
ncbi:MAG TPA: TlpA disulfide reductase family protein [Flavobacterium sp.]|jgi:thiol-disulfide isomerase/thioredoxin